MIDIMVGKILSALLRVVEGNASIKNETNDMIRPHKTSSSEVDKLTEHGVLDFVTVPIYLVKTFDCLTFYHKCQR